MRCMAALINNLVLVIDKCMLIFITSQAYFSADRQTLALQLKITELASNCKPVLHQNLGIHSRTRSLIWRVIFRVAAISSDEVEASHRSLLRRWSPWTSYQIRKITGCTCATNTGNVFPATDFKRNCKLAIPARTKARAAHTCLDACQDH